MSDKTGIEWTEATWNPVTGCTKVSQGCKHCYAEREWARLSANPKATAYFGRAFGDVKCHPERLDQPLRWKRPRRIFVNSMSDLFHEDVPCGFIDRVFAIMAQSPQHTFQVLTKRPERMLEYMTHPVRLNMWADANIPLISSVWGDFPLPNVWLGVSVEDQDTADERIPLLLQTPAAVRWVSAEPLLGPVDLEFGEIDIALEKDGFGNSAILGGIDWVVVGGESGPKARPMHPDWARSLRDQCAASGVPFLFKQWGEFAPNWFNDDDGEKIPGSEWIDRMGKKMAGRLLDGFQHDGYPS